MTGIPSFIGGLLGIKEGGQGPLIPEGTMLAEEKGLVSEDLFSILLMVLLGGGEQAQPETTGSGEEPAKVMEGKGDLEASPPSEKDLPFRPLLRVEGKGEDGLKRPLPLKEIGADPSTPRPSKEGVEMNPLEFLKEGVDPAPRVVKGEVKSMERADLPSPDPKAHVDPQVRIVERPIYQVKEDTQIHRMEGRHILKEITGRIFIQAREGINRATVRLEPPELGHIKVEILLHKGVVKAHISAEHHLVKGLVEANIPYLKDSLLQQGLVLDEVTVSLLSDGGGGWREDRPLYQGGKGAVGEVSLVKEEEKVTIGCGEVDLYV